MITVSIFNKLNSMIKEEAPFLRIEAERDTMTDFTYYNIKLLKSKYIDIENYSLNVTDELKTDIEAFLKNEGVSEIAWNNNYNTFWEFK